jgi:hypothetical protein
MVKGQKGNREKFISKSNAKVKHATIAGHF